MTWKTALNVQRNANILTPGIKKGRVYILNFTSGQQDQPQQQSQQQQPQQQQVQQQADPAGK